MGISNFLERGVDILRADDIYDSIEKWCKKRGRTPYSLIKNGNISKSTLYNMKNHNHKPQIDSIQAICDTLNITLGQFFSDDDALIEMTDRDKTLLEMSKSLNEKQFLRLITYLDKIKTMD